MCNCVSHLGFVQHLLESLQRRELTQLLHQLDWIEIHPLDVWHTTAGQRHRLEVMDSSEKTRSWKTKARRRCTAACPFFISPDTKVQFDSLHLVVPGWPPLAGGELQIQDKIAFIILFHAATMPGEKAPWLPAHFQSLMSSTES